jgi:hypothetical protein
MCKNTIKTKPGDTVKLPLIAIFISCRNTLENILESNKYA